MSCSVFRQTASSEGRIDCALQSNFVRPRPLLVNRTHKLTAVLLFESAYAWIAADLSVDAVK